MRALVLPRPRERVDAAWISLGFAALGMVATLPGRTQGLGLVTEPLIADLRLDRVTYATVNLWATLIGALFCVPIGRLVDHVGARAVMAGVLLALGVAVVAMSRAESVLNLWITVTLTRGLGQSALSLVSLALVGKWFDRRLNLAMGTYALLVGVGFMAAFPSVGRLVLGSGWRAAWLDVGLVVMALSPVAWLVVTDPLKTATKLEASGDSFSLAEALRTPAFWIFALASSMFGLVYSGIALFNESILAERGFDASVYHTVLVISTMVGLAANFGGGWLATRWPIQRVTGMGMAVLAISLLMLPMARTMSMVVVYAVTMGAAAGLITVVFFSVWALAFGRAQLGRIQGAAQMMTVVASAVGPVVLAESLRRTGSYEAILFVLGGVVAVLGIAAWRVGLPSRTRAGQ